MLIDNVVVLGSGAATWHLNRTLQLYRETVNPGLQFVNVDLIHTQAENSHLKDDPLNVNLFGFSDQILRFVADRGTTGQLAAVEAIDVKYNLRRDIRLPAINLREAILASEAGLGVARWRTVRVFISSTFLDFHGERDLLIRHALPELRSRARALRLDLQVVDLRWGITAQDAESARQVELCLSEVDRCQLFVGLLGARTGQTADTSRVTDPRLLEFLATQKDELSLTALEMLYATRDAERARQTAVFYERDPAFIRLVPGELMKQFSDMAVGRRRVLELRSQLQSRGCLISKYLAEFGPLGHGRYGATGLQTFGEMVLEQLWNILQTRYPLEGGGCDLVTEEYTLQHEWAVSRQLIGRKARLARAVEEVERGQGRFVLVSGKPGSGKTSFMARVYTQLVDTSDSATRLLVPAFSGAGQQCASSAGLVAYLRALLARQPLSAEPRHRQAAELAELLAVRGRRQHVVIVLDGLDALKTLEEKAWNNQLRTLTSKRGAGDPLYLQLACEELRTFGVFEQLSVKLSSLGQTVSALIQDIISRLEETFDAGMVRQVLCAVTISAQGLAEDDLFEFLKQDYRNLTQFTFSSLIR
ncbi:Telomerase protein component 1 [Amphibalanus amphitrite]|uniref:Telomerase protein component 1 n=1 Tax=Amphibalanus amphitrite TaxID=1232801 RepID=A0A6A4V738_AMPAM|nr:Telomerase protein component 1 [Amphibalanus amphitrite]